MLRSRTWAKSGRWTQWLYASLPGSWEAVFNDVASTVSFTWPHGSTSSDQMIQVMSRHRAKIRPTHGEIEILYSDPLTAMRSKDVQDYAADDTATGHDKGFDLKVGP